MSQTAGKLAQLVGGKLRGDADAIVTGVCRLNEPLPGKLCFTTDVDRIQNADPTKFGAVLLGPQGAEHLTFGTLIIVEQPRLAYAIAATAIIPPSLPSGVASSARVSETARLGRDVTIGENCVIAANVEIGDETVVRHNVVIGPDVKIGRRCLIKSNSVIGEEGFGFAKQVDGSYVRIPHVGSVIIGDGVEIGALNTVAAGTINPTLVSDGVKTDDHVHVAHNCSIGQNVLLTACVEISGSVQVGRNAWIGPNASVMDKIEIAAGTFIGLGATVTKSILEAGVYVGCPAKLIRNT